MDSEKSIQEKISRRKARINRREGLRLKRMGLVNQKQTSQIQEIESRLHDCSIERRKRTVRFREPEPMQIPSILIKFSKRNDQPENSNSMPYLLSPISSGESSEGGGVPPFELLMARNEEEMRNCSCLSYGALSVIGRQRTMEDAVRIVPKIVEVEEESYDFFAVYDGHGGSKVAKDCQEKLHQFLANDLKKHKSVGDVNWTATMNSCFFKMDEEVGSYKEDEVVTFKTVGSTAAVVVIGKQKIIVANCGDSRVVLSRAGVAVPLSIDHKPDRPDEEKRIESGGGKIINWNGFRVQGVLATSRSIGDHYLKPHVTSEPEVTVTERSLNDEFLVIASDGLWDVLTNEFTCEMVRRSLAGLLNRRKISPGKLAGGETPEAAEAASVLVELAMARGSRDNISTIVVQLSKS